jgi:hypothetical protein
MRRGLSLSQLEAFGERGVAADLSAGISAFILLAWGQVFVISKSAQRAPQPSSGRGPRHPSARPIWLAMRFTATARCCIPAYHKTQSCWRR